VTHVWARSVAAASSRMFKDRPHLFCRFTVLGRAPSRAIEPRFEFRDLDPAVFDLRRRGGHRDRRDPLWNPAGPN
jgi:hypothetical protein